MVLKVLIAGVIVDVVPVVVDVGVEVPITGVVGTVITGGNIGKGIIEGNPLMKHSDVVVVGRYGNTMLEGTANDGVGRNGKHIGDCESTEVVFKAGTNGKHKGDCVDNEVVLSTLKSSLRLLRGGVVVVTS